MAKSLLKSTSVVSAMTMISRVMGFVRDMLAAQIFGISASVDAFYIAFKIPNFMRNLFAEGSFSQAFVPVLSEYRQTKSPAEMQSFLNHMAGGLGLVLLLLVLLAMVFTPAIVYIFSPGLDPLRFQYATEMLRITFPYIMLISLTAFAGSILNSYGRFAVPAFTPVLLNISLIVAALWLAPYFKIPVESQAWGVFIAGVVQLLFQFPYLKRLGFFPIPKINWRDPGVQRVLKLMVPALFGASATQLSLLINTIFASFLKVGSVAWLYYSDRLAYFPLGVFGVALATVVLPHLSRKHVDKSPEQFKSALDWGMRSVFVIGIPATVVLMVLAGPIISTLFQYNRFGVHDVIMIRESVLAYCVGLLAFMIVKVLVTGYYSRQDIKTPVKIAIVTLFFNVIFNATLIGPLAHAGLALATSLSSWVNVFLLYFGLHRTGVYRLPASWGSFILRLGFANTILAIILKITAPALSFWLDAHWLWRFSHLFGLLTLSIVVYFLALWSCGMRLRHFRALGA